MSLYNDNKKKLNQIFLLILLITIIVIFFGININSIYKTDEFNPGKTTIVIGQNFGEIITFEKELELNEKLTAMDILNKVTNVKTTYGNAYVNSINEIESEYIELNEQKDWFYFINGILSNVGANQYHISCGDVQRWDFHQWNFERMTSAIVCDFPEPFVHGFGGKTANTIIAYNNNFYNQAIMIQSSLEEYGLDVEIEKLINLTENERQNYNIILIDNYKNSEITKLNKNANRLGWPIEFNENSIICFDQKGEEKQRFDNGGIVVACQNPWNNKGNWHCENVLWIITGITDKDVVNATNHLLNEDLKNCFGFVVVDNVLYKVP